MGQLFPYSFTPYKPLGFVGAAISSSEVTTLTVPAGTKGALIQATGGNVNWTDSGTAPTDTVGSGMSLTADAEPQWFGSSDLSALQFIAAGADTFLLVSYYG